MVRADDAEVAAIDRRDLDDAESFGSCDDRRVDGAQRQVAVARNKLGDPEDVGGVGVLEDEVGVQIAEEAHLGLPTEACREQIADLGDDERWYDKWAGMGAQQLQAGRMVGIIGVDVGVKRSRVDDQRDDAISAPRISSMRSEMSLCPLCPLAAAPRRLRRPVLRCASSAARVIAAIVTPWRWASCRSFRSRLSGSLTVVRRMGCQHTTRRQTLPKVGGQATE